jgi:hypothetical protein
MKYEAAARNESGLYNLGTARFVSQPITTEFVVRKLRN